MSQSNFARELADPSAGTNSMLYQGLLPGLGGGGSLGNLPPEDQSREAVLQEQLRQGGLGLDFLTGAKHNKGETFYDEHPVQATGMQALNYSPAIGAGVAGGGALLNFYKQHKNFQKVEPASMAQMGNKGVDKAHPAELLTPSKGKMRPDLERVFGDFSNDIEKRLSLVDQLGGHTFLEEYKSLPATAPREAFDALITKALGSEGHRTLERYVDAHEAMRRAGAQGGLSPYLGENLHREGGKIQKFMNKHVLPDRGQAIQDLYEHRGITGANEAFHEKLLESSLGEHVPDKKKLEGIMQGIKHSLGDPKHQASGLGKFWSRVKTPVLAGTAVGLGGMGLHGLLKAIQSRVYSKDKLRKWRKTQLESEGRFDEAERIK
jgi:hypothetical protein